MSLRVLFLFFFALLACRADVAPPRWHFYYSLETMMTWERHAMLYMSQSIKNLSFSFTLEYKNDSYRVNNIAALGHQDLVRLILADIGSRSGYLLPEPVKLRINATTKAYDLYAYCLPHNQDRTVRLYYFWTLENAVFPPENTICPPTKYCLDNGQPLHLNHFPSVHKKSIKLTDVNDEHKKILGQKSMHHADLRNISSMMTCTSSSPTANVSISIEILVDKNWGYAWNISRSDINSNPARVVLTRHTNTTREGVAHSYLDVMYSKHQTQSLEYTKENSEVSFSFHIKDHDLDCQLRVSDTDLLDTHPKIMLLDSALEQSKGGDDGSFILDVLHMNNNPRSLSRNVYTFPWKHLKAPIDLIGSRDMWNPLSLNLTCFRAITPFYMNNVDHYQIMEIEFYSNTDPWFWIYYPHRFFQSNPTWKITPEVKKDSFLKLVPVPPKKPNTEDKPRVTQPKKPAHSDAGTSTGPDASRVPSTNSSSQGPLVTDPKNETRQTTEPEKQDPKKSDPQNTTASENSAQNSSTKPNSTVSVASGEPVIPTRGRTRPSGISGLISAFLNEGGDINPDPIVASGQDEKKKRRRHEEFDSDDEEFRSKHGCGKKGGEASEAGGNCCDGSSGCKKDKEDSDLDTPGQQSTRTTKGGSNEDKKNVTTAGEEKKNDTTVTSPSDNSSATTQQQGVSDHGKSPAPLGTKEERPDYTMGPLPHVEYENQTLNMTPISQDTNSTSGASSSCPHSIVPGLFMALFIGLAV